MIPDIEPPKKTFRMFKSRYLEIFITIKTLLAEY